MEKYMNYLISFLFVTFFSCSEDVGLEREAKNIYTKLHSSNAIVDCWGYDVVKRENKFIFNSHDFRVIANLSGTTFSIDTVIVKPISNDIHCLKSLQKIDIDKLRKVAMYLQQFELQRVVGYNCVDDKIIYFIKNNRLTLKFCPNSTKSELNKNNQVKKTGKLDEHWTYIIY
jgi:hypothetical protein